AGAAAGDAGDPGAGRDRVEGGPHRHGAPGGRGSQAPPGLRARRGVPAGAGSLVARLLPREPAEHPDRAAHPGHVRRGPLPGAHARGARKTLTAAVRACYSLAPLQAVPSSPRVLSSVVEHHLDTVGVSGSKPLGPTTSSAVAAGGAASYSGRLPPVVFFRAGREASRPVERRGCPSRSP